MPQRAPSAGMRFDALPLQDAHDRHLAVIEAAAGARSKCKFEPALGVFVLDSVLPLGLSFPYSFGFLPSTLGEDGDPLDVLVLLDEALPPGSVIPTRLLGILEATQIQDRKAKRNDRLLAVADSSDRYANMRRLADVSTHVRERIAAFFVTYNREKGREFRPLAWRERKAALAAVARGHAAWQRREAR